MNFSNDDLTELKRRCYDAMGTGAIIARHPEYLLALIEEVEAARKEPESPSQAIVKVKATEKPVVVKSVVVRAPEPEPEKTLDVVGPTPDEMASLLENLAGTSDETSSETKKVEEKPEETKKGRGAKAKGDKGD